MQQWKSTRKNSKQHKWTFHKLQQARGAWLEESACPRSGGGLAELCREVEAGQRAVFSAATGGGWQRCLVMPQVWTGGCVLPNRRHQALWVPHLDA